MDIPNGSQLTADCCKEIGISPASFSAVSSSLRTSSNSSDSSVLWDTKEELAALLLADYELIDSGKEI